VQKRSAGVAPIQNIICEGDPLSRRDLRGVCRDDLLNAAEDRQVGTGAEIVQSFAHEAMGFDEPGCLLGG
jgi:hypothetical protein